MGMPARLCSGLALAGAVIVGAVAEPGGRSFAPAAPQAGAVASTPTVESVSRQAQREIRACDDGSFPMRGGRADPLCRLFAPNRA